VGNALALSTYPQVGVLRSCDGVDRAHNWALTTCRISRHGADLNGQVPDRRRAPTPCRARMPGHYSKHSGRRPCVGEPAPVEVPARLFVCVRCRTQMLICSCCDRGQIYCAGGCAQEARYHAQRAAGRRYQTSRRGRLAHAVRARRWRARQKNVTHQGSPPPPPDDLVVPGSAVTASKPSPSPDARRWTWHCHWCGCRCLRFVRQGFLRRRRVPRNVSQPHRGRPDHDDPP
jgi:hypothetical protein